MAEKYKRNIYFIPLPNPSAFYHDERFTIKSLGHTYARMILGDIIPPEVERIISLDMVLNMGEENEVTAANAAALCGKLSQLANGAIYTDDQRVEVFHDKKLDALEDLIEAANGKPVLVAYWYQHDYERIGKRISNFRNASGLTQEQFGEKLNMSRKHISQVEAAISRPSLEAIVEIANLLGISADDLLVDSLTHSASTANTEIHHLLLDCNEIEQEILTRMVKEMKAILYGLGI